MLILATTASKLKCKLAAAGTAANFFGVYADGSASGVFTPGSTQLASNGATDVTVVGAPSSGYQRQVKHCFVYNGETSAITVTTSYEDVSTTRIVSVVTIQPGASADTLSLAAATGAQVGVPNTWTAAQTFSGGIQGIMFGCRNKLINADMGIDQRNARASQTFTAAAALAYCVDRWYGYCTGANVTGQCVAGTAPNKYNYQFTGAASVTKIGFAQRIEAANGQDLAGLTSTLSVDLSNSLLTTVTWVAYYANTENTFGTLASPTKTQIATGTFTVSSTLARYSAQISIPSAATTGVEIEFSVGAQTSGTWTIGRVQFEVGSVATPYEQRHVDREMVACQFYLPSFDALNGYQYLGVGQCSSTTEFYIVIPLNIPARSSITGIILSNISHFTCSKSAMGSQALTSLAFSVGGKYAVLLYGVASAANLVAGNASNIYISNSAGKLLFTGAEL